jgi:hypothetical protein
LATRCTRRRSGKYHPAAKRLKGALRGLIELVEDFDGDTFRAVYTVKLAGVVYVLHVLEEIHPRDRHAEARDCRDHRPVAAREGPLRGPLREEERLMATRATRSARQKRIDAIPVTRGSGNLFVDLGLPNPEERLAKAQLASLIDDVIRERGLTQRRAASWGSISPRSRTSSTGALLASPRNV